MIENAKRVAGRDLGFETSFDNSILTKAKSASLSRAPKSLVACAVRTYSLDVYGCTSVAKAMDGLERPFGTAISMEMAVKRAHGARYGYCMPNDLGSLNFYLTLLKQEHGNAINRENKKQSLSCCL